MACGFQPAHAVAVGHALHHHEGIALIPQPPCNDAAQHERAADQRQEPAAPARGRFSRGRPGAVSCRGPQGSEDNERAPEQAVRNRTGGHQCIAAAIAARVAVIARGHHHGAKADRAATAAVLFDIAPADTAMEWLAVFHDDTASGGDFTAPFLGNGDAPAETGLFYRGIVQRKRDRLHAAQAGHRAHQEEQPCRRGRQEGDRGQSWARGQR